MISGIDSRFWWSVGFALAIAIASVLRKRFKDPDGFRQMTLFDWCLHFPLIGVAVIFIGGIAGVQSIMAAGVFLLLPLYLIAILGILGKLDDTITDIIRAIRRR